MTEAETTAMHKAIQDCYRRQYKVLSGGEAASPAEQYERIWNAARDFYQGQWVPIRTEADLPQDAGLYLVTTKPAADPFVSEPRVIKHMFDRVYKARFWLGSFSAWLPLPPLPEPYTPQEKP